MNADKKSKKEAKNLDKNALNLSENATSNESNLNLNANASNPSAQNAQNSSISDEILAQLRTSAFKNHATNFAKIPV